MRKPWSITTTVRNPNRLRAFLVVLQQLENMKWESNNQCLYQILLIQSRQYGYGSPQFYNGLTQDNIELINDLSQEISFQEAKEIFHSKNYKDPAMRGRQSFNPLKKMGLAIVENGKLKITGAGKAFIKSDYDFEEVFFRSFMKWQIPNPDSRDYPRNGEYDIKPFIGTLHLINSVNRMEENRGNSPKGISKREFSLFAPTLVHYKDIEDYAEKVIELRDIISEVVKQNRQERFTSYERCFASVFLETTEKVKIDKLLRNLKDYGDNAIRYFRLTRYIYIRGGGHYVDLESRRSVEIDSLLAQDNAQSEPFTSKEEYAVYISDMTTPQLPWETREKYIQIAKRTEKEIRKLENSLDKKALSTVDYTAMTIDMLTRHISNMRNYRQQLQDEKLRMESQNLEQIRDYIDKLQNIFEFEQRPILLEKLATLSLNALNDAIAIKPNYPIGDDNEPTFTAPANTPDIECFYKNFNAICEVTMLTDRKQWYNEGQPVMRHFRDFEDKHASKPSYCLFIAPKLHRDTLNTFWMSVRYEYEGRAQKIIPLTISNFVRILEVLLQMKISDKFLTHVELSRLFDDILAQSITFNDSNEWQKSFPTAIDSWQDSLFQKT